MIPFAFLNTPASTFTPASLTSIVSWLDASNAGSVTLNSGNVSQINDLSGNGNNGTQAVAINQPIYSSSVQNGLHAIHFAASTVLELPNSLLDSTAAFSIGIILKADDTTNSRYLYFAVPAVGADQIYIQDSANTIYVDLRSISGRPQTQSSAVSAGSWYRMVVVWDSSQSTASNRLKIYLNNVDAGTVQSTGSGSTSGIGVTEMSRATSGFTGYIGEAVYGKAAWTSTELSNLDSYWTSKWAI